MTFQKKKTKMIKSSLLLLIFLFMLQGRSSMGQDTELPMADTIEYTVKDNLGLFESDDLLDITLRFDITHLMKKKSQDEYLDGEITFYLGETDSIKQFIKIKSRGNRRKEVCFLPPLRLNFKTGEEDGKEIVNNLKLVTHCQTNEKFELYIFREYLCYRLYNIVTDYSLRVRLLRIKYVDTGSKGYNVTRYGFVIEPTEMFAERFGAVEMTDLVVRPQFVSPFTHDRVALFNYMIGNDDWYLTNLHNLKVFNFPDEFGANSYIVPYDFDYSGLVDTHYSFPNPEHDIESVLDRIYLGPCRSDEQFREVLDDFLGKKDQFMELFNSFELMDDRKRQNSVKYLEGFFEEYKRDQILFNLKKTCTEIN